MGQAKIIDGKAFAAALRTRIAAEVGRLKNAHGITPGLAVVLVGDDPASEVYVRFKGRRTEEAGMRSYRYALPAETGQDELLALIGRLNRDPKVNGIVVQLPLPPHIETEVALEAVDAAKDVDGFDLINAGSLVSAQPHPSPGHHLVKHEVRMVPCTPLGCLMLIKDHLGDLTGLKAVVLGRSNIVGKPMAVLLLRENCTVTITHSRTRDLADECHRADILVAAVGRPHMVKGDWIKPGATVIDVGINRIETGNGRTRLVGDVDFDEAVKVAGAITPVPGGVGPMTIACLIRNALVAACLQNGLKPPEI